MASEDQLPIKERSRMCSEVFQSNTQVATTKKFSKVCDQHIRSTSQWRLKRGTKLDYELPARPHNIFSRNEVKLQEGEAGSTWWNIVPFTLQHLLNWDRQICRWLHDTRHMQEYWPAQPDSQQLPNTAYYLDRGNKQATQHHHTNSRKQMS